MEKKIALLLFVLSIWLALNQNQVEAASIQAKNDLNYQMENSQFDDEDSFRYNRKLNKVYLFFLFLFFETIFRSIWF